LGKMACYLFIISITERDVHVSEAITQLYVYRN